MGVFLLKGVIVMKRIIFFSLICGVLLSAFAANAQDSSGVTFYRWAERNNGLLYLALQDDIAFAATDGYSLRIYDVSDFDDVQFLGGNSFRGSPYKIIPRADYLFAACGRNGGTPSGIRVFDISDLSNPQYLVSQDSQGNPYGLALKDDYLFLGNGATLQVYDVSDPARPERVGEIRQDGAVYRLALSGDYLYAGASDGLRVYDISEPDDPRQVGFSETPKIVLSITMNGDHIYTAENSVEDGERRSNLRIFDITDPENPEEVGVFGELDQYIYNITYHEGFIYMATITHLHIIDVSDPENPEEVGWYQPSVISIFDVAVRPPYVLAAQSNGLAIYDCSNAIGEPDLEIAEDDRVHDFGEVVAGLSDSWDLTLGNTGHSLLEIDGLDVDDEAFVLHCDLSRWSWQGGFSAGDVVHDQRLGGVEFDGENFYVTGGNNGDMVNQVYVFNREGELARSFEQFAESPWGMRDLAWDGELLWGSDGGTVYGFTTDGELETEFQAPLDVVRSLAWDPQRELLWISDLTSPIFGVDREGNIAVELDRVGVRIYGMAWYPEDLDGCQLYLATWDQNRPLSLHKLDVEEGDMFLVRENLEARIGERAGGGLAVTRALNPPCWDLVVLVDGAPDAVEVWQLTDYYRDEAIVIPADDEISVTVEFAPSEVREYEGTLTVISNDEEEPEVQVSLVGIGRNNRAPEWAQLPEAVEIHAGELIQFEVQGRDPDENPLIITLERGELPYRARLEDNGDGSASFSWQTDERDVGQHSTVFILSDRVSEVRGEVPLVVSLANDIECPLDAAPLVYRMDAPQPNPFNQAVTLRFTLPEPKPVLLAVYNIAGREVARLIDGELDRGTHSLVWNADHLSGGIYIARLSTPLGVRTVKLVLVK